LWGCILFFAVQGDENDIFKMIQYAKTVKEILILDYGPCIHNNVIPLPMGKK
jgi:hypothetical protein